MTRPGAVITLCISVLLALSACGSTKAPATATGTRRASSATPAGGSSGSAQPVRIGPYTVVFATPLPANPAEARVIEGFREAQILWDKSEHAWHLAAPVTRYVTGHALGSLIDAVTAGRTRHLIPAGTERYFLTRVSSMKSGTATVITCDDGSKFKEENPQTGAAYTTPLAQAYAMETWRMVRFFGHWGVTAFSLAFPPSPSAAPCQP